MKLKVYIFCIATAILYSPNIFAQSECAQILAGGIYDYHSTMTNTERASSFVNWFKQKQFSSYSQAKSAGLYVGIPIDGFLTELGFSTNESGFQQFQNEIENYQSGQSSFAQRLSSKIQTINQGVLNAWEYCISQSSGKVVFWVEQTSDPNLIMIASDFRPRTLDQTAPELLSFSFTPKSSIKIEGGDFFNEDGSIKKITYKGERRYSQTFVRNGTNSFGINIGSTESDGLQVTIPAIQTSTSKPQIVLPIGESWSKARSGPPIQKYGGTSSSINGGNNVSANDGDRIEVTAQYTGKYLIQAKGTYKNTAYTKVNVFFSIYSDKTGLLKSEQVGTDVNADPAISTSIVMTARLNAGERVELRYGNNGAPDETTHSFRYAHTGDSITITLLGQ